MRQLLCLGFLGGWFGQLEAQQAYTGDGLGTWNTLNVRIGCCSTSRFFTDKAPYFERNRVSGAVGYEFSRYFGLQIGYLHQFDYRILDEIGRDFLQVTLLFNLPRVNVGSREQGSAVEQLD